MISKMLRWSILSVLLCVSYLECSKYMYLPCNYNGVVKPTKYDENKIYIYSLKEEKCDANYLKEIHVLKNQTKCKPRPKLYELFPSVGKFIEPNLVILNKCEGICNNCNSKCISTKTNSLKLFVREIKSNKSFCRTVTVDEDVECKCDPVRFCKRECKEKKSRNFKWNPKFCSCKCRRKMTCTTGWIWNSTNCECVPYKNDIELTLIISPKAVPIFQVNFRN